MAAKPVVLVTGGTGYLATEIIHQLLGKGYSVRATVRSKQSEAASRLSQLFPAVQLFEADLLKEGSFDEVVSGSDIVLHTASPFPTKVDDPQKELIEPALNGTKNVLSSVEKNPKIKTVVVTGSCAAVVEHFPTDDGTKIWTEEDWNTTSTLKDGPYRLSKVLAEKYAYEWAAAHPEVALSSILPTFIIGPPLYERADATSIKILKGVLDGSAKAAGGVPAASFGMVDIRDVAAAHIAAFEKRAKGRFILSSEKGISRLLACDILRKHFPAYPIPDKDIGELKYVAGNITNGGYSQKKTKEELGITFTSVETSLVEMANKLIELGIVPKV